jgi:hypothetical protein
MEGPDPRLIVCLGGTREQNSAGEAEARARCVSQSTPTREEALERLLREQVRKARNRASLCRAQNGMEKCKECSIFAQCDDAREIVAIDAALEDSCPDTPPSC